MVFAFFKGNETKCNVISRRVHANCELNNAKRYILDNYKIHNIF